jgi:hypothetical protein
LEALIREELKKATRERKERQLQGFPPSTHERMRLDKVPFYLKVYDLALTDEPYKSIALSLKSSKSTVQCAHVAALRLIGGSRVKRPLVKRRRLADWEKLGPMLMSQNT